MAQLDRQKIANKAPWVAAVFGTKNIGDLPQLLNQNRATDTPQVKVDDQLQQFPSQLPAARASRVSSWVAISVGCNNTCTFCIVPTTRGKEKDRRPGDILDEVRQCVANGAKEVTLLGQNVNPSDMASVTATPSANCCVLAARLMGSSVFALPRRIRPLSPMTLLKPWLRPRT